MLRLHEPTVAEPQVLGVHPALDPPPGAHPEALPPPRQQRPVLHRRQVPRQRPERGLGREPLRGGVPDEAHDGRPPPHNAAALRRGGRERAQEEAGVGPVGDAGVPRQVQRREAGEALEQPRDGADGGGAGAGAVGRGEAGRAEAQAADGARGHLPPRRAHEAQRLRGGRVVGDEAQHHEQHLEGDHGFQTTALWERDARVGAALPSEAPRALHAVTPPMQ